MKKTIKVIDFKGLAGDASDNIPGIPGFGPKTATKLLQQFAFWLLIASASVSAETFSIESAHVSPIGNGHVLNAKIKYPLTPRVKEALANGVPITFSQQFKLISSIPLLGKYWQWEESLWATEIRFELRYHALTEQYILVALDTRHHRNFSSLDAALNALGLIENLSLPPKHLNKPANLRLEIRSGLDLNALPTPMRPGALISRKWQLTSPWAIAQWP